MSEGIEHGTLVAMERGARIALWPALAQEGERALTAEELADGVRELVAEVHRLRQTIAIRRQSDRIAEQIEKGFR